MIFQVLMNAYGSERRMCLALGVQHLDDVAKEIENLFKLLSAPKEGILDKLKMLPKLKPVCFMDADCKKAAKGECQEIVMRSAGHYKTPCNYLLAKRRRPVCYTTIIHTKDPNTGTRNVGMYRMQVFEPTLTGMHWHKHKVSAKHFSEYKKLNKRMPVACCIRVVIRCMHILQLRHCLRM
jgi:4-hydroxy-3-polyprenylbenzoate decarboxylase